MARVDPRQREPFGAAFYAAYAAAMAPEGVDVLTFGAPVGPFGVIDAGGDPGDEAALFPAYQVLRALAGAAGRPFVRVDSSDQARVRALAYRSESGIDVVAVNLTGEHIAVNVAGAGAVRIDPYGVASLRLRG
jgi:hypothetical protein